MIAPLLVWRRGDDDVLLLTEPELGDTVVAHLTRMRFAAKCEIELEQHTSTIVLEAGDGIAEPRLRRAGVGGARRGGRRDAPTRSSSGCGSKRRRRASAARSTTACCRPRPGSTSARSRSPRAATRDRSRSPDSTTAGKVNRRLRVLEVDGDVPAARDAGRARREGGRPRDERRARARARLRARRGAGRRSARGRRTRCPPSGCSLKLLPKSRAATLPIHCARSSGDRALACGGRGRKFESCRAHGSTKLPEPSGAAAARIARIGAIGTRKRRVRPAVVPMTTT